MSHTHHMILRKTWNICSSNESAINSPIDSVNVIDVKMVPMTIQHLDSIIIYGDDKSILSNQKEGVYTSTNVSKTTAIAMQYPETKHTDILIDVQMVTNILR